jgi:hypothetical protein
MAACCNAASSVADVGGLVGAATGAGDGTTGTVGAGVDVVGTVVGAIAACTCATSFVDVGGGTTPFALDVGAVAAVAFFNRSLRLCTTGTSCAAVGVVGTAVGAIVGPTGVTTFAGAGGVTTLIAFGARAAVSGAAGAAVCTLVAVRHGGWLFDDGTCGIAAVAST